MWFLLFNVKLWVCVPGVTSLTTCSSRSGPCSQTIPTGSNWKPSNVSSQGIEFDWSLWTALRCKLPVVPKPLTALLPDRVPVLAHCSHVLWKLRLLLNGVSHCLLAISKSVSGSHAWWDYPKDFFGSRTDSPEMEGWRHSRCRMGSAISFNLAKALSILRRRGSFWQDCFAYDS
jgi:hypothetical protein